MQVVAGQVQQRVLQHRAVTVGEHEAVAVGPPGVGRVVPEEIVPQHFGDVGHAHRHARVAGLGRLDGIHGKGSHGVGKFAAGGHGWLSGQAAKCELSPIARSLSRHRPASSSGAN